MKQISEKEPKEREMFELLPRNRAKHDKFHKAKKKLKEKRKREKVKFSR